MADLLVSAPTGRHQEVKKQHPQEPRDHPEHDHLSSQAAALYFSDLLFAKSSPQLSLYKLTGRQ